MLTQERLRDATKSLETAAEVLALCGRDEASAQLKRDFELLLKEIGWLGAELKQERDKCESKDCSSRFVHDVNPETGAPTCDRCGKDTRFDNLRRATVYPSCWERARPADDEMNLTLKEYAERELKTCKTCASEHCSIRQYGSNPGPIPCLGGIGIGWHSKSLVQKPSDRRPAPTYTWVELFHETSHSVTRHVDVERLYVKAHCLCVQTSERDADGNPKIHHYWLGEGGVSRYVTAHRPYSGTTQQVERR